jgi:endonuclease/exonuclease/phosphatase family metal-dependent hydrolase
MRRPSYQQLLQAVSFLLLLGCAKPITVDGFFSDWEGVSPTAERAPEAQGVLQSLQMAEDTARFYLRFTLNQSVNLQSSDIELCIDGDDDPTTGQAIAGVGVDLIFHLGRRQGLFRGQDVSHQHLELVSLPTHADSSFELSIPWDVRPAGEQKLFKGKSIQVFLRRKAGDKVERLPAQGAAPYFRLYGRRNPPPPLPLEPDDTNAVRLMSYNIERDGPTYASSKPRFRRIIQALEPDIICFNEFFETSAREVRSLIAGWLPPETDSARWYATKEDAGNVTLSRWPIRQSWRLSYHYRATANLIELPPAVGGCVLVINCHFRCCGADDHRQREADIVAAFIRDAQTPGGEIDLPEGTPIFIAGDLNLVGEAQQLQTLRSGDIENEKAYGEDHAPDWDGTDLTDAAPRHTHVPLSYTWRDPQSSYSPGRLDYILYTDSRVKRLLSFVFNTQSLPFYLQAQYKLEKDDSQASDHLPLIFDWVPRAQGMEPSSASGQNPASPKLSSPHP